jgi:hypothetical protein
MAKHNFHIGYFTLKNEIKGQPLFRTYHRAIRTTLQSEQCILHERIEITASYLSNVFSKDINCNKRNSNKSLHKICTLIYLGRKASSFKADSTQTKFNKFYFHTAHCTVKRVHVKYIVKIETELSLTKVQYVGLHYMNKFNKSHSLEDTEK